MIKRISRTNFHQKSEELRSTDFNCMIRLEIGLEIRYGGVLTENVRD